MGNGDKVLITKEGEKIKGHSGIADITRDELKRAESYARQETTKSEIRKFIPALGITLNDDLVVLKEIEAVRKSILHIDTPMNDDERYKAIYFEHPFKGEVVFVGKRKSRTLKVKPGDIVYYDSELRMRIFMFNNTEYMITSLSAILGVLKYEENFLCKLVKKIRLNLFK